ncbi:SET domain-containing protein SmydA-8-like isoform X2 [Belonocnema kinseyi]|uniref:SET domain-containing protein SmydA-8-like isoform X2 n=1 Tax=Belonocnema kinseyi TaxID=2817044 RepID=UPI00143D6DA2|nr:SET domain-containing protein SmydA-8-like isoform X2 [Belonocnema kinseyi]
MSENAENEVCAMCKSSAKQKCSGCRSVFYCNREHQKLHWKEHSKKCIAFRLAEDEKLGRHYVATRRIEIGDLILRDEKPLVEGPLQGTTALCLSCYVLLNTETAKPCEKCGWPLCSNCVEHGPECQFTTNHKGTKVKITDFDYPHPTYRCIAVVRALCLKETNPKSYKRFLSLEDHNKKAALCNEIHFHESTDIARFVKRFFKLNDVSENEIAKIAGILKINGHEVPTTEPAHMAVYDLSSFLEHSCRANGSKSFTAEGALVIRAASPISKGEHITICYTDPLWGVTNRRHHLLRTKFFECMCTRCTDPTEFMTMFNAIMCTKGECNGSMLPKTFILHNEERPDYICHTCNSSISWRMVEQITDKIGVDLSQMRKGDVQACKTFIHQHAKTLHENHFYMTDVKLALSQLIGQQEKLSTIDIEMLSEKILLCKKLDELLRTIAPAENRVRGVNLFEMHAAISEFGRRQGQDELRGILMESRRMLTEAYKLLRHEPEILPEGQIAIQARNNIREIDLIMKTSFQHSLSSMYKHTKEV